MESFKKIYVMVGGKYKLFVSKITKFGRSIVSKIILISNAIRHKVLEIKKKVSKCVIGAIFSIHLLFLPVASSGILSMQHVLPPLPPTNISRQVNLDKLIKTNLTTSFPTYQDLYPEKPSKIMFTEPVKYGSDIQRTQAKLGWNRIKIDWRAGNGDDDEYLDEYLDEYSDEDPMAVPIVIWYEKVIEGAGWTYRQVKPIIHFLNRIIEVFIENNGLQVVHAFMIAPTPARLQPDQLGHDLTNYIFSKPTYQGGQLHKNSQTRTLAAPKMQTTDFLERFYEQRQQCRANHGNYSQPIQEVFNQIQHTGHGYQDHIARVSEHKSGYQFIMTDHQLESKGLHCMEYLEKYKIRGPEHGNFNKILYDKLSYENKQEYLHNGTAVTKLGIDSFANHLDMFIRDKDTEIYRNETSKETALINTKLKMFMRAKDTSNPEIKEVVTGHFVRRLSELRKKEEKLEAVGFIKIQPNTESED
jgi:hypothetical protein